MSNKEGVKKLGRERLQRIIEFCKSVEDKGVDPFVVDVDDIIMAVRKYFPEWEVPEDFCLDAETINRLSTVIKLQSEWVKHRSTSLYTDPFLLEDKMRRLSNEKIVEIFLQAWHPIVELEQISSQSLVEAAKYWRDLLPLSERWKKSPFTKTDTLSTTREEMVKQRLLAERAFAEDLETFWGELRGRVGKRGKIRYWDFIGADTYAETVRRAYLTSFLVTYGYATLEIRRLEGEIFIVPFKKPMTMLGKRQAVSIPISVDVEEWRRWKEAVKD